MDAQSTISKKEGAKSCLFVWDIVLWWNTTGELSSGQNYGAKDIRAFDSGVEANFNGT